MKRLLAAGAALVGATMLMQGTAFAAHGIIERVQISRQAFLLDDGSVVINGRIECTTAATEARFRVGATLVQPDGDSGRGGPQNGTCTGSPVPFRVVIQPGPGDDFNLGLADVTVKAQTGDSSGEIIDRETATRRVEITAAP